MKKQLLPLLLLTFVNTIGFTLLIPVLPFIVEQYSASPFIYGLLLTAYSLFQFLAAPVIGALSDKYGRRPTLLISQLGTLISWILFGIAWFIPEQAQIFSLSLPLLIIGISRIIDGITGGNVSVANAYMADITSKSERTKNYGLMGAAMGVGFIIGPALGGFSASQSIGYLGTVLVAMTISSITLITIYTNLTESLQTDIKVRKKIEIKWLTEINLFHKIKTLSANKNLKFLFIRRLFFAFGFACLTSTFTLYAKDFLQLEADGVGFMMLFIGLFAVLNQTIIVTKLSNKLGNRKTFNLGQIILAISIALIGFQPNLLFFVLIMYLTNLGMSLSMPTFKSMLTNNSNSQEFGKVTGVDESILAGSNATAPLLAGATYGFFFVESFFFFAAILLIPYLLYFLNGTRNS